MDRHGGGGARMDRHGGGEARRDHHWMVIEWILTVGVDLEWIVMVGWS
jgi:hypothetical protein